MTVQIAVKLSDELLRRVDELVSAGELASRSVAVRVGLEALVEAKRHLSVDDAYREAYSRCPETDVEVAEATRMATRAIHEEPWDRWW